MGGDCHNDYGNHIYLFQRLFMKQYLPGMAACLVAVALSAFTIEKKVDAKIQTDGFYTIYYFRYKGIGDFSAPGYMTAGNWEARGVIPGSDDCPAGADEMPCVIYASMAIGNSSVSDLMMFFTGLGYSNVESYVEDPSHIYYFQPEP